MFPNNHDPFGDDEFTSESYIGPVMSSYRFQEATGSELKALHRLDVKCYDYPLSAGEWQEILSTAPQVSPNDGSVAHYKCQTYRINNTIIGFYVYDNRAGETEYMRLLRFGIHPEYRQQGIGSLLMDNAIAKAKSLGLHEAEVMIPEYWLDPDEDRGIIKFVETSGMAPVEHVRDFYFHYGSKYDGILYRTGGRRKVDFASY